MTTRRRFLRGVLLLAPLSSGCLDFTAHETVHLQLVNWRRSEHMVTISSDGDDFEESIEIAGNGSVIRKDFLEPAERRLRIELETGESREYDLPLDCEEQLLTVRLEVPDGVVVDDDCWPVETE